jgi:5-methylcytosine-specific restriction endonuclease McrA
MIDPARKNRGRSGRAFLRHKKQIQDEATHCERCGKPISSMYKWPDPRSVTVGHILPLEYGGDPDDRGNLRAECIACNTSEGARMTNNRSDRISYENGNW